MHPQGEIVSLKATLMKQRAEKSALLAQVAQLRSGRTKPHTVQRNGAVKALADAFQAAAEEPHTPERLQILSEAAAISEKIPAGFGSPTAFANATEDNEEGEWAEVAGMAHSIPSVASSSDLESLRLAQENEEVCSVFDSAGLHPVNILRNYSTWSYIAIETQFFVIVPFYNLIVLTSFSVFIFVIAATADYPAAEQGKCRIS